MQPLRRADPAPGGGDTDNRTGGGPADPGQPDGDRTGGDPADGGSADGDPADGGSADADPADDDSGVLAAALGSAVAAFVDWGPRVLAGEPDSIHQMRVQARTLRALLGIFAPRLDEARALSLAAGLKRLGRVLGDARDAEVVGELFVHRAQALPPALATKRLALRGQRLARHEFDRARSQVVVELGRARQRSLLAELQALAAASGGPGPGLQDCIKDAAREVDRKIAAASRVSPSPEDLHDARKAAKQLRYAAKATGVVPEWKIAKELLDALGAHHDSVILQAFVRRVGREARKAGEDAFGYGVLWGAELARQEQAVMEFLRAGRSG